MNFKIDSEFSTYWPNLTQEKLSLLETSILNEGLREDLVVWKEENILLDGHQRLSILNKHSILFEDRIKYLSFLNRDKAKYWIYMNQAARRGDTPRFFRICRVLEFESIYREEAKERQGIRTDIRTNYPNVEKGKMTECMARDAETSHGLVSQVIYIRDNDKDRFEELKKQCQKTGEDVSIDNQWNKIKAIVDAEKKKLELDKESIDSLGSGKSVQAFERAITQSEETPSIKIQKEVAKRFVEDEKKLASGEVKKRTETIKDLIVEEQVKEKLGPKKKLPQKTKEEVEIEKLAVDLEMIFQGCSALRNKIIRFLSDLRKYKIEQLGGIASQLGHYDLAGLAKQMVYLAEYFKEKKKEKLLTEKKEEIK